MTLLRDPTQAANGLSPIFDKQKELERMQEAQMNGEVGQQATQLVVTKYLGKANEQAKDDPKYAQSKEYKKLQAKWGGGGSDFQRGMQAATAALQGLAGGDIAQAAAGAAAPYLAQLIKQQTPEGSSRVMAHALVQGALAAAQNKNVMVSATGELVGMLATELYHREASQLTEGEKETVSTLATLAAGLAGGLTGADGTDVLASAQTGKTVVENNQLSGKDSLDMLRELEEADKTGANKQPIYEKYKKLSDKQRAEITNEDCSHNPGCAYAAQVENQDGRAIVDGLKRFSFFSSLNDNDLADLQRFVVAENQESAVVLYQALPESVKLILQSKELLDSLGGPSVLKSGAAGVGAVLASKVKSAGQMKVINTPSNTGDVETVDKSGSDISLGNKEKELVLGGAHKDTSQPFFDGMDSHHCPAKHCYSGAQLSIQDGPVIKMLPEDHRLTASYGSSPEAKSYRAKQQELISQGRVKDAIKMDVDDIRS